MNTSELKIIANYWILNLQKVCKHPPNAHFPCRCRHIRHSESSKSWRRSLSRIAQSLSGSECVLATKSDTTLRDVTGDAPSWSCKHLLFHKSCKFRHQTSLLYVNETFAIKSIWTYIQVFDGNFRCHQYCLIFRDTSKILSATFV